MKRLALFFIAVVALAQSVTAQEGDSFAQANQEYAAGHFREAIKLYEKTIQDSGPSAAVFYDLGNAFYRDGQLGEAILNYERALTLEPHHPEAEANLRLVRDKAHALELKRADIERFTTWMTATQYTIAAAVTFWIGAFALAAMFFARRRSSAVIAVFVLSLIVFAAAIYGVYSVETGSSGRALAIVTAKSTEARLATADSAGTVLALPPGSEIKILSTRGDWIYAALPNDLRGWIPARNAERVRL